MSRITISTTSGLIAVGVTLLLLNGCTLFERRAEPTKPSVPASTRRVEVHPADIAPSQILVADTELNDLTNVLAEDIKRPAAERQRLITTLLARKNSDPFDTVRLAFLCSLAGTPNGYQKAVDLLTAVGKDETASRSVRQYATVLLYNTTDRQQLSRKLEELREMESTLIREQQKRNDVSPKSPKKG